MDAAELSAALQFACALAAHAGLQCARDIRQVEVNRKPDDSEVTATDLAIQCLIADRIRETYPDHALLGEESAGDALGLPDVAKARHVWVVDPLDGTRNFARGLPCYSTSIALLEDCVPVVGVIREHAAGLTWMAARGEGAFIAGRRMHVTANLLDSRAVVAFQPTRGGRLHEMAAPWIRGVNVRSFGSTAVHLALVAEGGLDAALAEQCYLWDVAAGAVMLEEAGGRLTDLAGGGIFPFDFQRDPRRQTPFIAGGSTVHQAIFLAMGNST